jgi:maltoporin
MIYTLALYNESARDNRSSPYLAAFGPRTFGHYLGARAEWWF